MDNANIIRSMSKKGCSPDNSACEGVFGRLKIAMFYGVDWSNVTINEFISILNEYLIWYNEERIKSTLNYMSPLTYRKSLGLINQSRIMSASPVEYKLERRFKLGSISMPQGRGNRQHNLRYYGEGKLPSNVDASRTEQNIVWKDETTAHAYHRIFDNAVSEYNAK